MIDYFKAVGRGIIFGLKHPFKKVEVNDDDDNLVECAFEGLGIGMTQGLVQSGLSIIAFAVILAGIGYVNEKMTEIPNVKMVIER